MHPARLTRAVLAVSMAATGWWACTAAWAAEAVAPAAAASAAARAASEPAASSSAAAASTSASPASAPRPVSTAASAPADQASAMVAGAPADATRSTLPKRLEDTLDSWQQFLDELLIDALGPNPERRYRVFGQRKTVDLGKNWLLALDERPTGLLTSAGTGIPAAGQPARTWELLHAGRINDLRFYNQRDGSGHQNGGAVVTTLAPGWSVHTEGLHLHDDIVGVDRTDGQVGLRVGPSDLWVEGFVRHAQLKDNLGIENWGESSPRASFGGVRGQWNASPTLSFTAEHQSAIKPHMAAGDERLAKPLTEFGADYRPGGEWSGTRLYWREAPQMGLLSSSGVEERTTYRRVFGAETPEGSKDGLIYAQIRHQSLIDDKDALLVLGWRHTTSFTPQWQTQTLIETGIPIGGDNAVRSNTFDYRVSNNEFPYHALFTEVQVVRTPVRDSAFGSFDYTKRLSSNSLGILRGAVTGLQPHGLPNEIPVNSGDFTIGWGWQEPEERHLSTLWRFELLGRDALRDNVVVPGFSDRHARIVFGEFTWDESSELTWMLHGARRWDHDDAVNAGELRTTNLTTVYATRKLSDRWKLNVHVSALKDSLLPAQRGVGTEISIQMNHKIVLALGFNFKGIDDGELSGDDRLSKGVKLRLYIPSEAVLTHWLKPGLLDKEDAKL